MKTLKKQFIEKSTITVSQKGTICVHIWRRVQKLSVCVEYTANWGGYMIALREDGLQLRGGGFETGFPFPVRFLYNGALYAYLTLKMY